MSYSKKTVFSTNPLDKVEVIDVNSITTTTPLNGIVNTAAMASVQKNVINALAATKNMPGLNNAIAKMVVTGKFDPSYIKDRLKVLTKVGKGNLDALGGTLLKNVMTNTGFIPNKEVSELLFGKDGNKPITQILKEQKSNIELVINDTKSVVKGDKYEQLSNFTNLMGSLTGNPDFVQMFDYGDELNFIKEITSIAAELQIPGTVEVILNEIKVEEQKVQFLQEGIEGAFVNADIEFISASISKLGKDKVKALVPTGPALMLASYRLPPTSGIATTTTAATLVNVLNSFDPNWAKIKVGNKLIWDLDVLANANSQTKENLILIPEYVDFVLSADLYPKEPIMDIAKRYYPSL